MDDEDIVLSVGAFLIVGIACLCGILYRCKSDLESEDSLIQESSLA